MIENRPNYTEKISMSRNLNTNPMSMTQVGDYFQFLAQTLLNIGACQQSFVKSIQNLINSERVKLGQLYEVLDLEKQDKLYENDLRIFLEQQDVLLNCREARILLNFFDNFGNGYISKSSFFEMFAVGEDEELQEITPKKPLTPRILDKFVGIFKSLLGQLKDIEEEKEFLGKNSHFNLKTSFDELDINQRGYINTRDIYDFLTDFLDSVRFRTAGKIFAKFPKNDSGKVTFAEWAQFLEPVKIEFGAKARIKRVRNKGNLSQRSPFFLAQKNKKVLRESQNVDNFSKNGSSTWRVLKEQNKNCRIHKPEKDQNYSVFSKQGSCNSENIDTSNHPTFVEKQDCTHKTPHGDVLKIPQVHPAKNKYTHSALHSQRSTQRNVDTRRASIDRPEASRISFRSKYVHTQKYPFARSTLRECSKSPIPSHEGRRFGSSKSKDILDYQKPPKIDPIFEIHLKKELTTIQSSRNSLEISMHLDSLKGAPNTPIETENNQGSLKTLTKERDNSQKSLFQKNSITQRVRKRGLESSTGDRVSYQDKNSQFQKQRNLLKIEDKKDPVEIKANDGANNVPNPSPFQIESNVYSNFALTQGSSSPTGNNLKSPQPGNNLMEPSLVESMYPKDSFLKRIGHRFNSKRARKTEKNEQGTIKQRRFNCRARTKSNISTVNLKDTTSYKFRKNLQNRLEKSQPKMSDSLYECLDSTRRIISTKDETVKPSNVRTMRDKSARNRNRSTSQLSYTFRQRKNLQSSKNSPKSPKRNSNLSATLPISGISKCSRALTANNKKRGNILKLPTSQIKQSPPHDALKPPDSHRFVTGCELVDPLKTISKSQLAAILKEFIIDYKELESARIELSEAVDYNVRDFFKSVRNLNQNNENEKQNQPPLMITEGTGHRNKTNSIITQEDMEKLLQFLGLDELAPLDSQLLLDRFDRDRDEGLSFWEFEELFSPFTEEPKRKLNQKKSFLVRKIEDYMPSTLELIKKVIIANLEKEKNADFIRERVKKVKNVMFDLIDYDGKGFATLEDFGDLVSEDESFRVTNRELRALISRFDFKKDGRVSFGEFAAELNTKKVKCPMKKIRA